MKLLIVLSLFYCFQLLSVLITINSMVITTRKGLWIWFIPFYMPIKVTIKGFLDLYKKH